MIKSVQNTIPPKSELTIKNLKNYNQHTITSINTYQESPALSVTFDMPKFITTLTNNDHAIIIGIDANEVNVSATNMIKKTKISILPYSTL